MVHHPVAPSSKALGKRPMRNSNAATPSPLSALTPSTDSLVADEEALDECGLAPSTAVTVHTRLNHKRVLPSRVRRGGVGSLVGTNEIDVNILDMLKRKGENDPLIPARTVFILTTDSKLVPAASSSEIGLNQLANERYFERSEVIRAYQSQRNIQVPEFSQIREEMVGGRLRTRSGAIDELSDAKFEKRHRKHEMIEKRQRLREKEKLQHEHYKLKERIEQLRTMDPSAFLALPEDVFGSSATGKAAESPDGADPGISSTASLHEAERRRKVMLDAAMTLEERYRTLLPPRLVTRPGSMSVEPLDDYQDEVSIEPDQDDVPKSDFAKLKPVKLKLKVSSSARSTPPATESGRKRRGISAASESTAVPPEVEPQGESIVVTFRSGSSHSESRQTGVARTTPVPKRGKVYEDALHRSEDVADMDTLSNHVQDLSVRDTDKASATTCTEGGRAPLPGNLEEIASMSTTQETIPSPSATKRRRQRTIIQSDTPFNVIHYIAPPVQEPSHKKQKAIHVTVDDAQLTLEQVVNHVSESPRQTTDGQLVLIPTSSPGQAAHARQLSLPMAPQPDVARSQMVAQEAITMVVSAKAPLVPPDGRLVPFAQLRQLEKPDQGGEFDMGEPVDLFETPTADEPVTPPIEPQATSQPLIGEAQGSLAIQSTVETPGKLVKRLSTPVSRQGTQELLQPLSKRIKRRSTPISYREPSESMPPAPPLSDSLHIISEQSYEIPISDGTRKRLKELPFLLAVSRHNVEPGRKTSRSVKAFGVDVPSFEAEEDFVIHEWMIDDALLYRNGADGGESDGDATVFLSKLARGEEWHDADSISASIVHRQ